MSSSEPSKWAGTSIVPPPGGPVPLFAGDPVTLALAWFPAEDYQEALTRWPELTTEGAAKGAKDHADYNRALQRTLQDYADDGGTPVCSSHRSGSHRSWRGAKSRAGTRPTPAPATPRPWPNAVTRH